MKVRGRRVTGRRVLLAAHGALFVLAVAAIVIHRALSEEQWLQVANDASRRALLRSTRERTARPDRSHARVARPRRLPPP